MKLEQIWERKSTQLTGHAHLSPIILSSLRRHFLGPSRRGRVDRQERVGTSTYSTNKYLRSGPCVQVYNT